MARPLQPGMATTGRTPVDADLPWRVISLLNVYRLLLPMLLLLVFFFDAPTHSVGQHQPGLFLAVAVGYFVFAVVCIQTIARRTPAAPS